MPPLFSSRLKIAAATAVILLAGAVAAGVSYRLAVRHAAGDLIHDAAMVASVFDADEVASMLAADGKSSPSRYAALKSRLQRLKASDDNIRYLYLFRFESPQHIVFLADSKPDQARDALRLGDTFAGADSAAVQQVVDTGTPMFEGPLRDGDDVWTTAYAIVGIRPAKSPVVLLGLDTNATELSRGAWFAAARSAALIIVMLGLPLFAYLSTRQQGEQREAIRNLSEAVEQSHSAITILDLEHRIEYANRGLCQQIGYARRELIGRHLRDFIAGPDSAATITDLVSTMKLGRSWEGEWLNLRKDGTAYPVHGMVTPVRHREGAIACFVAIFDDVSDTKRKEGELREARDLAEAGDRAKGQFLATMSHEVRTPLNGIVGFTSLLLETPLSAEQREFVQTIRASGEALIQLTGDILDFARIESGKMKLDPISCDPRECLEEALDLHAAKAVEKGVELLHSAALDVPSAVLVDSGRLRQVLVNLVGNAVKFTDHGQVEARVRVIGTGPLVSPIAGDEPATRPKQQCTLEFTVRDSGIGISTEQQARLFKPFSQADESSTRRYGGAGLGLAICKNLVQLMGGSIGLSSEVGKGTTVTFMLPVPVTAAEPPQRNLDGLKVGLAMESPALQREMAALLKAWNADLAEEPSFERLAAGAWDIALVQIDENRAKELVARAEPVPGLPPEKTLAIVPISLSSELRTALRAHFRLLINRPIHHGALVAMLSGTRPAPAAASAATKFGFRVLVVEDNEVNQRLLLRVLDTLGCSSSVVQNGIEAIAELTERAAHYDVVLLDLHMPEMDGLQALERIRRGDAGPRARTMWIIALTADVRPEQRAKGFATGLNDYLTKPLRVPQLEAAFNRFRAERQARKG